MTPSLLGTGLAWISDTPAAVVPIYAAVAGWNAIAFAEGHGLRAGAHYVAKVGDWMRRGYATVESVDGDRVAFTMALWSAIPTVAPGDELYEVKTHAEVLEERLAKLEREVAELKGARR